MVRKLHLLPCFLLVTGCLREAAPVEPPRAPAFAPEYRWPPRSVLSAHAPAAEPQRVAMTDAPATPPLVGASRVAPEGTPRPVLPPGPPLTDGEVCLLDLAALGIEHSALDERRGVRSPVVINGRLGEVDYVGGAGLPLELDCRMALALNRVGPLIRHEGIDALRFSGAYVYRQTRKGRLSLHAYGLAIDVHAARVQGHWHEVKTDFRRGAGCEAADLPVLNRLACSLKSTGLFKELLTPDYNADHHDHFHLAIEPLADPMPSADARQAHVQR